MANMSYCRFHNTRLDLMDCLEALESGEELGKEEFKYCKLMFGSFIDFCVENGIVDDDEELDEKLEEFFETINVKDY